jgi:two-component system nitrogen regulation sensor histidine kinase GlnL
MVTSMAIDKRYGETGDPSFERAVLAAIPSGTVVVDDAGSMTFVNPAAEQLLGLGRAMLEGRRLDDLVAEDSTLFDLIRRVQVVGSGISDYGVDLALKRRPSRKVDLHVAPLAERPGWSVVVVHPCSVAERLNRQILHRGGARSVAGLAMTLAHEVKNPLSGIRGAAQLLEPGVAGEEQALTRLICAEADRICALVDRMEEFSDRPPVERAPVNIHRVLERVRRVAEAGFARHGRLVERFDPSLPDVDGDFDQLVQVFMNLVKNAAEAVDPGGEITLRTQYDHGLWMRIANSRERVELPITVQVEDDGGGIGEEIAADLFEPFVSSKASGTGLGLALVAKIIGDHGGLVEVENTARGANFRIRLPAWRGENGPGTG